MNVPTNTPDTLVVTLSRRNLEHLLLLLDKKVGMPSLHRYTESGVDLHVRAEENVEHYGPRTPGRGADMFTKEDLPWCVVGLND